jgi:hypothetical protein
VVTLEDLESYFIRMGAEYEELAADGMYLVRMGDDGLPMVVHHTPPLLILRLKVMDLPEAIEPALYRSLLELNASDLVHGAYGIEQGELVLGHTFQLEGVDFQELQAALESLQMAAAGHMAHIRSFVPAEA